MIFCKSFPWIKEVDNFGVLLFQALIPIPVDSSPDFVIAGISNHAQKGHNVTLHLCHRYQSKLSSENLRPTLTISQGIGIGTYVWHHKLELLSF